ncbi:MAG: response regulator [Elusimicrobiota bacterium]
MATKILFAEDELDLRVPLQFRLRKAGYEVLVAVNGQEACDMAREHRPDIILLDVRMPILDGISACRQIRSCPELKDVPVILMTASVEGLGERAKQAGADAFMIKPFEPEELYALLKRFTTQETKHVPNT